MIDNFEATKHQLKELAPILNSFKSEAVQLRLVELIFDQDASDTGSRVPPDDPPRRKRKSKQVGKSRAKPKVDTKKTEGKTHKRVSGNGTGAHAMVSLLVDDGFFKKPQSIRSIIDHLGSNKGRHFKANQISPSLLRLLREGRLSRNKNSDNQYEYSQA